MRVERLFLAVPRGCLQFVIVVFPDHTHLLFLAATENKLSMSVLFSEDGVQIKLKESTYVDRLAEMNLLRQFAYIKVEETGQTEAMFEDFILQKPHLELEVLKIINLITSITQSVIGASS